MEENNHYQQMKDRALRLLAMRDHSISELRSKLRQKLRADYNDEVFKQVVTSLQSVGYLVKEEELALRWVAQWRKEGRGRHWISGKLRSKGLPSVSLNDDEDELEAAKLFIEKKMARGLKNLTYKDQGKLARAMVSRGFSQGLVATLVKTMKKDNDHDESL